LLPFCSNSNDCQSTLQTHAVQALLHFSLNSQQLTNALAALQHSPHTAVVQIICAKLKMYFSTMQA